MTFFDFLNLTLQGFSQILNITVLDETYSNTRYQVTLGGLFLGFLLIGVIFRFLFSISGLVGGSVPSASSITSALIKSEREKKRAAESKMPRVSYHKSERLKGGTIKSTSWRE